MNNMTSDSEQIVNQRARKKGQVPLDTIVMMLFMIMLVLILTAQTSSSNVKEQQALLRDLDLNSVTGLQRLLVQSLQSSWNVLGVQFTFDVLETRLNLSEYWFNENATLSISPQLVDQELLKKIGGATIPSSIDVRLREGRVRQVERNVQLGTTNRAISAGTQDVSGRVDMTIKVNGQRPAQVDATTAIAFLVPIKLQSIALAGMEAASTSSQIKSQQLQGNAIAYDGTSRQFNVLALLNSRLSTGLAAANAISSTTFRPLETIETNTEGSALVLVYDNSVKVTDGRIEAASGRLDCSPVLEESERRRRELFYNRYAGVLEKNNVDRLSSYVDSPRAYIAASIDSFSQWDSGKTEPLQPILGIFGTRMGLLGLPNTAYPSVNLFDPQQNLPIGIVRFESSFKKMLSFGLTGDDLLSAAYAHFVDAQIVEDAFNASETKTWAEVRVALSSDSRKYLIDQSDAARAKFVEWKRCKYSVQSSGAATAKFILAKPIDLITVEPIVLSIIPPVIFPPTLATYYGPSAITDFNHAIEVLSAPETDVKAAADGSVTSTTPFSQFGFASATSLAIVHRDRSNNVYYTVYGNVVANVQQGAQVKTGDVIGIVNTRGKLRFGLFDNSQPQRNSINPCIYLGCFRLGQEQSSPIRNAALPETGFDIFNAMDYAAFESIRSGRDIRLSEGFCSIWNKENRGLNSMAYRYYSSDGGTFNVWPAYQGEVVRIDTSDEESCGRSVFVKTEDFVTVYGRINPRTDLAVGDKVTPSILIGTVSPTATCPNPHLRVSFAPLGYRVDNPQNPISQQNACGATIERCRQSEVPFRCDNVGGGCFTIPEPGGAEVSFSPLAAPHVCSAVEWEAVFANKASPIFWREREGRGTFERAGPELNFRTKDRLQILDCANPANAGKHDLIDEKEIFCANGKAYACGLEIKGATNLGDGGELDTNADGAPDYICASAVIGAAPSFLPAAAQPYYTGTRGARFCRADGSDDSTDWFCCYQRQASLGGANREYKCISWNLQNFRDTGRLTCSTPAPTACPG